ncbi:uncharacterized protein LOC141489058 [Macrotis lagotis]|uniref:uncharacterized protein LOC141489058 n=1 Tax=Macrotis lagotis TaxID=92651 RepID=UPI003D69C1E3
MAGSATPRRRRQPQPQPQRQRRLMVMLRASGRRFASLMSKLVAKYNHPFEDDALVRMDSLTYQTPQGLRKWGGRLVTKRTRILQTIQTSLEKEYSIDKVTQSTVTDVKGKRNVDNFLKNDSIRSLPENDLDKKCMARVDVILEDEHPKLIKVDSFSKENQQSYPMILSSKPFFDHSRNGPWKTNGIPDHPTSSPQDAEMSPNQSLIDWRAKRKHLSRSLCVTTFEDEESAQDLTLSDIYVEMLYSLFKCLPSQKSVLVSTNKYASKVWVQKKKSLNITFTMRNSFLKLNQTFEIISDEKNSLICRKDFKQNILPYSEQNSVAKDNELLPIGPTCFPSVSSPSSALRGPLYNLSIQESPSRSMDGRRATLSPSLAAQKGTLHIHSIQESPSRSIDGRQAAPSPPRAALRGTLHNHSIQESPSRSMDGRQAAPSPSREALRKTLYNLSIQESSSRSMDGRQATLSPSRASLRRTLRNHSIQESPSRSIDGRQATLSPSLAAQRGTLYNHSIQESPSRSIDQRQAAHSPSQEPLKKTLYNLSIQESPSRTMVERQAVPSPSQSSMGSQSPSALNLCLPPNLTSAKERFCPLKQSSEGDTSKQGSMGMPWLPQTPKNAPLPHERLCQELSASAPSEACPGTGFPRKKGARKALPFGMEQTTCKAQDSIDSIFDAYSQETTRWAQELLSLRKSRQKSKMLTPSKLEDSLEGFIPRDGLQGLQKAAFPQGIARNSSCETVPTVHCTTLPRTTLKEDFFSPTKRRKVLDSQT